MNGLAGEEMGGYNTQIGSRNQVKVREWKQDLAGRPDLCPPSLVYYSEFPM